MNKLEQLEKMFFAIAVKDGQYLGKRLPSVLIKQIEAANCGEMGTYKEKIYGLLNGTYVKPKCQCGQPTVLKTTTTGFTEYCSVVCSANSAKTKGTREATNLQRYGVKNTYSSKELNKKNPETVKAGRQKAKKTLEKRYGVNNPGQTIASKTVAAYTLTRPDVKQKIKETFLEKYGVDSPLKNPDVREQYRTLFKEKYGVEHCSLLPAVKEKRRVTAAKTYAANVLPQRLAGLATLDIYPSEWDASTFTGGEHLFLHKKCGQTFTARFEDGLLPFCPHCKSPKSKVEDLLAAKLSQYVSIQRNNRTIIKPKEIDILIENVGVEVNGVYWHSEGKRNISLLEKTNMASQHGINLLHFWDYEIIENTELVTSIILSKLKRTPRRIFARSCNVIKIGVDQAREFFDNNHLSGFIPGEQYYALEKDRQIVFAIILGKSRFDRTDSKELFRLCSAKFSYIVGGFERLLKAIALDYPDSDIISYADRRYATGKAYERVGFLQEGISIPNYMWIKGNKRLNRIATQKHRLPKLLGEQFNPALSERENMLAAGWLKIVDCGNLKFRLPGK